MVANSNTQVIHRFRLSEHLGFAAYDSLGGLQDCGAGTIDWHASPVGSGSTRPATAGTAHTIVRLTKGSDGHVTETVTINR